MECWSAGSPNTPPLHHSVWELDGFPPQRCYSGVFNRSGIAMNHHPEPHWTSARFVLAAVLVVLLAGNGCGSKETKTSAPALPTKATVVSAEKTSFHEVTSQLDPGGSLYGYLSTSQWLEGLSGRVNGWRDAVLSMPTLGTEERSNVTKAFDKGLKTTAEFKRLAQGMPSEGNAFSFVSQRLSDIV